MYLKQLILTIETNPIIIPTAIPSINTWVWTIYMRHDVVLCGNVGLALGLIDLGMGSVWWAFVVIIIVLGTCGWLVGWVVGEGASLLVWGRLGLLLVLDGGVASVA